MAKRIYNSDEEEVFETMDDDSMKSVGVEKMAEEFREKIMAINDPKLLAYIIDCCYARQNLGRADEQLTKKSEETKDHNCVPCAPYPNEPKQYKPL